MVGHAPGPRMTPAWRACRCGLGHHRPPVHACAGSRCCHWQLPSRNFERLLREDSKLGSVAACRPSFSDYPLRLAATSARGPSWADSARRGDSELMLAARFNPSPPNDALLAPAERTLPSIGMTCRGDAPFRRGIGGYVRHDRIVRHLPAWPTTYVAHNKHDDQGLSRSAPPHRCMCAEVCRNRACRDTQRLTEPKVTIRKDNTTPALLFFK